jgi:hypothetical protein
MTPKTKPAAKTKSAEGLTVGATCGTCPWSWKPEHRPTQRDVLDAYRLANLHRAACPGHVTSVSAIDRRQTSKGSRIRMLALEIER